MLKLPKGLKKKKKGKKSKKDQELFTEEELEQYKREHQSHPEVTSEESTSHQQPAASSGGDEEWSKFAALTTGVDSILKKTQGDLDRIKSTSFFQRKLTANEQQQELKHKEEEAQAAREALAREEAIRAAEEAADPINQLLNAVVELSESEEESDAEDGAFDTTFVDQELPEAYIPEEPEDDFDLGGPDPFDTAYAEKLIKGPEVSKRGKRIVNIGAAVEVLTGKVETAASTAAKSRRQRRGIQNLLLESFEANSEDTDGFVEPSREPATFISLLDDPSELTADINIDLSVSLHLSLQKEHQKHQQEEEAAQKLENNILDEFDVLNKDDDEDDEFAQLAAESLNKTDEANVIDPFIVQSFKLETPQETSWAEFQVEKGK